MNKFIISESEKKRILNMHKSSSSRHYLSESTMAPEPVITNSMTVQVFFAKDGDYNLDETDVTTIENWLRPLVIKSLPTIQKFYNDNSHPLPKFITIGAGTTSKGSYSANQRVAVKRINEVTGIVTDLLEEMGINDEIIQKIITTNSDYTYKPTSVDSNLFDRNKLKSKDKERFAYITVKQMATKGLSTSSITDVEHDIEDARGSNFNPDETEIVRQICRLETYSDITDLNDRVRGGLQNFINNSITDEIHHNDTKERYKIMACLNTASNNSDEGDIAAIAGDKITIILK
jgi:hypothetical protein